MSNKTREEQRQEYEEECLKCIEEYRRKCPYDYAIAFLRNRCTTCEVGIKLKQLDSPEVRGRVGGWQPW